MSTMKTTKWGMVVNLNTDLALGTSHIIHGRHCHVVLPSLVVAEVALSWVTPEVHLGWINVSDPWVMRMGLVGRDGDSLSRDKEATRARAL